MCRIVEMGGNGDIALSLAATAPAVGGDGLLDMRGKEEILTACSVAFLKWYLGDLGRVLVICPLVLTYNNVTPLP
jgi:hypothetical protein